MNPYLKNIITALESPASIPDEETANSLKRLYPYFFLPQLLRLQRLKDTGSDISGMRQEIGNLAIACPSQESMSMTFGGYIDKFKDLVPKVESTPTPDTDSTIDKFLDCYGSTSQREINALETAIFNPQPEYASILEKEAAGNAAPVPQTEEDRRISLFISAQNSEEEQDATASLNDDLHSNGAANTSASQMHVAAGASFTESLASSYIRQKKYSKALEILQRIAEERNTTAESLLTDRIRFIKKLMIIENHI